MTPTFFIHVEEDFLVDYSQDSVSWGICLITKFITSGVKSAKKFNLMGGGGGRQGCWEKIKV